MENKEVIPYLSHGNQSAHQVVTPLFISLPYLYSNQMNKATMTQIGVNKVIKQPQHDEDRRAALNGLLTLARVR